ncbi:BtrH N-terminal domain-containing protein [Halopenitus sp. POP-27]|uniref:BtrH N-terminal domain-containing protein n=1 Tax=Halopenitus sp. POP-27 TaxID=2994425 RepID=UPI0024692C14|nr:BtrH N-terminal domain-containing protein [Halopenitus sp. POP-27]
MSAIHDGRRGSATPEGIDHASGFHCGSTALRGLSNRYGWGLSETACFGLGGVGFTYFTPRSGPDRAFFGRPPDLETTVLDRIGVGYDRRSDDDWEHARHRLEAQLANGNPVLLATDVAGLPYFDSETHFAPHRVLCVGLEGDDDGSTPRRIALVADNEFDDVKRVPLATLREAMTDDHLVPIRNRTTVITDPRPERGGTAFTKGATGDGAAAKEAIETTARSMLDPSTTADPYGGAVPATTGIAGIRALAADLPDWADRTDPRWTARMAAQNVDARGTGGGAFRRPYASFLEQATDVVPGLPETAPRRMCAIADDWSRLATAFRRASEAETTAELSASLERASRRIRTIAEREERFWKRVLVAVA